MTPERAEEVLKMSRDGKYFAACGPDGEQAIALHIIAAERDKLLLQIGELRTQLKGAVFFIHLDKHTGATFGQCPAPVCSSANEVLGDLAEKRKCVCNPITYQSKPDGNCVKCG